MRLLLFVFFVGITSVTIIGFLVFNSSDNDQLDDFKKQADFLTSNNEYERAIFYCDEILLIEPNSSKILLEKANALVSLNKFEQAIETFDIILNLDPDDDDAQTGRTLAQEKMLMPPIVSEHIITINKETIAPLNASSIYQQLQPPVKSSITKEIIEANKFYDEKKYHEALSLYESVLSSDPTNLYALNGKAGTLLSLKQFDDSISTFENTLQIYPDNVNALNGKAYAYYLKAFPMVLPGLFYDSVHTYQKTLEIDPKNMNALVGIASSLGALERYDEATHYYREALSVDPDHKNARNSLFSLWIKLGNEELKFFYFDSAIAYFDKVLEMDPNNLNALLSKAGAYTEWGKSKEKHYVTAENMYNEILEIYPNNTQTLVGKGYVLNEQLKFEEALPYFEKALEIDPDHFNAQRGQSLALRHILYGG